MLRAVAALLVVFAHLPDELDRFELHDALPNPILGVFGVDLFFVISGFIMVLASGSARGPRAAGRFALRRIVRIMPLYWGFTTIFAIGLWHAARHVGLPPVEIRHIAASYLFIPEVDPVAGFIIPTYELGWTLNYEMFFYACFATALLLPRRATVPSLAAALTGLVVLAALLPLRWPFDYWGRSQILEFVYGMLIASMFRRGWHVPRLVIVPTAAAALVAAVLYVPYIDRLDVLRGIAWGLPAAAIVAATVLARPWPRNAVTRGLESLGDASYSLYLVHYVVFRLFASLLRVPLTQHLIPASLYAMLLVVGAIGSALALYRWVELPMSTGLRRLAVAGSAPLPAPLPAKA